MSAPWFQVRLEEPEARAPMLSRATSVQPGYTGVADPLPSVFALIREAVSEAAAMLLHRVQGSAPHHQYAELPEAVPSFFLRVVTGWMEGRAQIISRRVAQDVYTLEGEGTRFWLVYLGSEADRGAPGLRMRGIRFPFSFRGDGEYDIPLDYIPATGRFVLSEDNAWLLTSDAVTGYGWFIDTATQELVVTTQRPGSYRVNFTREQGAIYLEVPDDWMKQ